MNRREFITLLGGAAAATSLARPLVARAEQQSARPVVGFLNAHSVAEIAGLLDAFLRGLSDYGYDEGRDVLIDFRWADGQYDRLPELAADLVRRQVAVIVGSDNPSALAAKRATTTIPIVFTSDGGPVALGLVTSLNRPGGNVTGVGLFSGALAPKRLSLLRELVPSAQIIGMLADPKNLAYAGLRKEAQDAARSLGIKLQVLTANSEREIDAAFAGFAQQQIRALMVGASPEYTWRRCDQIVGLAAKYAIPAIYPVRRMVAAGGLMSYGTVLNDTYRQVGIYTAKILKGAAIADLPVEQSSRFDYVINEKTGKVFGLEFPRKLLALADEVIE
jgi:putative tryptophan/tyrosine transport system substrate-binding protein